MFLTSEERAAFGKGPTSLPDRLKETATWAGWAPGLTVRVVNAWLSWKKENGLWPEACARRCLLRKMTEQEALERHQANDHSPFRRGCPVCVASQGRQRSHWRASFTGLYSISVDIAGPFKPGRCWDPVASGRDKGLGYKYFLAAAFTIPLNSKKKELPPAEGQLPTAEPMQRLEPPASEVGPVGDEVELPDMVDLFGEEDEAALELVAPGVDGALRVVSHRFRSKGPEPGESTTDPPLPPPLEPPPELVYPTTRTLFLGIPLRSRKGGEAMAAVRALINRLEATGFPVHRYHSDRAKELRSRDLVAWLQAQGIHHTWTPGESPAGNKAELAVQHLKAAGRKLLAASGLGPELWPFAIHHASNRNWVQMCEQLGLTAVHLLPFGLQVHARRRLKHTDRSSWSVKTMPGRYLGQAPNTPGGHLVWCAFDGGFQVLLTSTVYPVVPSTVTAVTPKYRVRTKTAPEFVMKTVSATPVWGSAELSAPLLASAARLSPGGEWEVIDGEEWAEGLKKRFWPAKSVIKEQEQGDSALSEQRSPRKEGDSALLQQRSPRLFEEGQCAAARSRLNGLNDLETELLRRHVGNSEATFGSCFGVLQEWFDGNNEGAGAFNRWDGWLLIERKSTADQRELPVLREFLGKMVENCAPDMDWTTLLLIRNGQGLLRIPEEEEPAGEVWIVSFGEFQGGGLWIEGEAGEGSVIKVLPGGVGLAGSVVGIKGLPVRFQAARRHAIESWMGGDMWVLKAFRSRGDRRLEDAQQGKEALLGNQFEALSSGYSLDAGDDQLSLEESSWEVEFPHFLVTPEWKQGAVGLHEAAIFLRGKLLRELAQFELDLEGLFPVSRNLLIACLSCSWFERVLESGRMEGVAAMVRSVSEIPLREPEPNPADQFLQTRTVSLDEARQELELWRPAAEEEILALEVTTGAVERVSSEVVEGWVNQGWKIVQVPGKAVLTRKAGVGKRRLRAVCCGNHIPSEQVTDKKADLYAGGIDALTVRVVLAFVAQQESWGACVVDVKTAFLYAPVRGSEGEGKQVPTIIVKPPHLLVQLGVMKSADRWKVKRALYGLQTSPRDWAVYRDKELRSIALETPAGARLKQGLTDESLWFVKSKEGRTLGLMIVYVDDIALFGPGKLLEDVVTELGKKWRLSEPSWASMGSSITFCGMELTQACYGWRVTQKRYLQELLGRYKVEGTATVPLAKWEEPSEEAPDLESVRRAQGITGALLWAVTRSRPDMAFVVSRMAQLSTKCPQRVFEMGIQALRYATTTLDLGLEFRKQQGPSFGHEGQLSHSRASSALEVYADASHSPNGERSLQCVIVAWKGCLLLWEATRQAFTTLSTAESELVGMIHAAQVGECVSPIIEELVEDDIVVSLLGDNMAALAAYEQGGSSWRNRHLRMRANAGREKVAAGALFPSFVPGHLQVADVGTKPLPASKLLGLLSIVNVRLPLEAADDSASAAILARIGRGNLERAGNISPALLMALTVLSQVRGVESRSVGWWSPSVGWYWLLPQAVVGQPPQDMMDFLGTLNAIVVGVIVLVCMIWGGVLRNGRRESDKKGIVEPPAIGREQPSSSWEAGPFLDAPEGVVEPQEEGETTPTGAEGLGGSGEVSDPQEVCVFPVIGRFHPGSNWVPMHFLRGLLSLVGGLLFRFVGVDQVEVWRLRAVARTFRYGVASAYEKARGIRLTRGPGGSMRVYDLARADIPRDEEGGSEDIDEVRHVPPEEYQWPPVQDVPLWREESSASQTDSPWESLTSSTESSISEADSSVVQQTEQVGETGTVAEEVAQEASLNVAYRAVDGALIVVYGTEELRVELPGWAMEEVHSIVESIQLGDWTPFHEVMSWEGTTSQVDWNLSEVSSENLGLEPGEIAVGSQGFGVVSDLQGFNSRGSLIEDPVQEEHGVLAGNEALSDPEDDLRQLEPLEEPTDAPVLALLLERIGCIGWLVVSSCFLVGFFVLFRLLLVLVWSVGRMGFLGEAEVNRQEVDFPFDWFRGADGPGVAVGVVWLVSILHRLGVTLYGLRGDPWRVCLLIGQPPTVEEISLEGRVRRWLWIVLIVLIGFSHPNEARVYDGEEYSTEVDLRDDTTSISVSSADDVCASGRGPVDEAIGRSLAEVGKVLLIILAWEILKRVRKSRSTNCKTVSSQTLEEGYIPLPLPEGVPNRAEILFSLWRAGFNITAELYPEEVQSRFYEYLGDYLRTQSRDEEVSE